MTYKNTKTGFVFNTPCEIKAEGWERLDSQPVTSEAKEEKKTVKPVKKRTKKDE